ANSERPSAIARKLQQSRQAVYSQITLIREKVARILDQRSESKPGQSSSRRRGRRRQRNQGPIPLPASVSEPQAEASACAISSEATDTSVTP
ncbi:MAG: hypothetical protein IRZ24_02870, partial [Thermogemmatispora sp.]|uniref:hypothetical protein n=1 Tax=Thermogemmatispora sp. TaxID=1968838 RepID=UPI001DB2FB8C